MWSIPTITKIFDSSNGFDNEETLLHKSIVHASSNGFDDGETPLQLKAIEDAGANLQIGDDVYDDDVYDDVHEQNTIMMMMTT